MNFMRKKPQVPLIDQLSSIYNQLANQTIQNLSLEKQGDYEKAIRGWKSIHTQVLFKLDLINKSYANHEFTADEYSVKDGIDDLIQKAIVHLTRVECVFNDLYPDHSRNPSITTMNPVTNPANVPTLRNKTPQTFTVRQHHPQQQVQSQQSNRLLKTLRDHNGKSNFSNSLTNLNTSSASMIAATTATHSNSIHTSSPKQNWSTSKPLPQRSSYRDSNYSNFEDFNTTPDDINIFDDSFNDNDLIDFNEKMDKRNESLSRLEAAGKESQFARFKNIESDSILPSQFEKLQIPSSNSSPPSNGGGRSKSPAIKTQPPRPPVPRTKPLIDFDPTPKGPTTRKVQQPSSVTPNTSSTQFSKPTQIQTSQPEAQPAKPKPIVSQVKPMVRPVIKSYVKQPAKPKPATSIKTAPKPVIRTASANGTTVNKAPPVRPKIAPATTASHTSTSTTTTTTTNKINIKNTLKPPASNPRSRSQSPRVKAPAQASVPLQSPEAKNSTNGPNQKDKEETELTEKEIKEKMEDQIINEIPGIDYQSAKQIFNEIVIQGDEVHWEDIAGLETAKNSLKETVVYPFLRPDLFSGLREPARGMLLFGPPGTGKTMLARAVATESKSTFFSISASSLTSKYLGESEKLVRALFLLARKLSPAIVFVDEIDSILSSRSENGENESSRRIKNEFLIQWSNLTHAAAGNDHGEDLQRVLVLAATNLPWQIDEAARRRFVRRQYIPLPEFETRLSHLRKLIKHQIHNITEEEILQLAEMTDGYSGSDITALAKDAAMGPLRSLGEKLLFTEKADIRGIELQDFVNSLKYIKPSVSKENLKEFDEWAEKFGSSGV